MNRSAQIALISMGFLLADNLAIAQTQGGNNCVHNPFGGVPPPGEIVGVFPSTPLSETPFKIRVAGARGISPLIPTSLSFQRNGQVIDIIMGLNGLGFSVGSSYCREDEHPPLAAGTYLLRYSIFDTSDPASQPVLMLPTRNLQVVQNNVVQAPTFTLAGLSVLTGLLLWGALRRFS